MKFTDTDIIRLYREQADKHGAEGTSTIQDMRTRHLEMNAIFSYVKDGLRVLEVGCGNGFVAEQMARQFNVEIDAFDYSHDMIAVAKKRDLLALKGKVNFSQGDLVQFNRPNTYDLIFSERCVQNLLSWDDQKHGIENIARALKKGGEYVMLESFWTGLDNLNTARAELGIEAVPEFWHNLFFKEDETLTFAHSVGLDMVDQNRFLSGYYFGSRVLLPALLPEGKKANSQSILNDFFCALPAAGDFCPMKIVRFRRRT